MKRRRGLMQVSDKLIKPLTEAKYLNADNVSRYRCIMRIFFEHYEKLKYWLYQEEVYEEMIKDPFFADYRPEQCQQDLTMLTEWKNLNTIQDTKKVASIEEFKNKKYRYQMTEYSVEIERLVLRLENLFIEGASLEPTLLERIRRGIERFPEMVERDKNEVYTWWTDLNNDFVRLNQTYQDFEIVIVNDGSTDGSVDEVKKFLNPRIRLINQKNGGVSAARNRGIEEAKGEYIAFLDADDVWDIDHLEVLYQLILAYPKNGAYATAYRNNIEGATHNIILKKIPFKEETGVLFNYFEVCSCSHPPVWSSSVCIAKNILCSVGGFPVEVKSGEDLLTWARIAVKTDWAYSIKATATYMMPPGNSFKEKPARPNDGGDIVCKELLVLLDSNYPRSSELRHFIGRFYKMKASINLRYGFRLSTVKECLKSLRYRPFAKETYPILFLSVMPRFLQKSIFSIHSFEKVNTVRDIKNIFGK